MKFHLSLKILSIFICLVIISGCGSESLMKKLNFYDVSVREEMWNESNRNMYKIYLSMMRIDSLSADLNLKFSRKNAQEL